MASSGTAATACPIRKTIIWLSGAPATARSKAWARNSPTAASVAAGRQLPRA